MADNPRTIPQLREKSLRLLSILRYSRGEEKGALIDQLVSLWLETARQQTKPRARSRGPRDKLSPETQAQVARLYLPPTGHRDTSIAALTRMVGLPAESQGRVSAYCKELDLGHRPLRR